jgi:hypothetical protein
MNQQETAPPREQSWPDHLHDLSDRELEQLAQDYRWLDEALHSEIQSEFHRRREAIIAECKRRGKPEMSRYCNPPIPKGERRP